MGDEITSPVLFFNVFGCSFPDMFYTMVKVDGATPKRWRFVRGHDKPRLMGVASHLLSRWYIYKYIVLFYMSYLGVDH